MVVILSIVFVIAGVLLYDYFTARRWQQVTSGIRNEIVFQNRNKEYGAYTLRRDYDKRMIFIMLGVALVIGLAYSTYLFIKSIPEEEVPPPPVDTSQFTVQAPPVEEVPPPPKEELPPPMEKTVAFMPPVVVDIPVDDEIPPQEAMEEVKASTKTNDTDVESWEPPVVGEEKPPVIEQKEEPILDFVEEEAEFVGGHAALNAFIVKKIVYPQTAQELNIQGKCYIAFTVNKDGSISNVRVERGVPDCPECDREAVRVVKSMPNWKPGKHNGKTVRSTCRLPINFTLN